MTDYTQKLITDIKLAALEIYERAEELAGDSEGITDFMITINFEQPYILPTITCVKSVVAKNVVENIRRNEHSIRKKNK